MTHHFMAYYYYHHHHHYHYYHARIYLQSCANKSKVPFCFMRNSMHHIFEWPSALASEDRLVLLPLGVCACICIRTLSLVLGSKSTWIETNFTWLRLVVVVDSISKLERWRYTYTHLSTYALHVRWRMHLRKIACIFILKN